MSKVDWAKRVDLEAYFMKRLSNPKVTGRQITGCCPLHEDTSASFSASLDKPVWTCFSKCGHGNLVQFHAKLYGLSLPAAEKDLLKDEPMCHAPAAQASKPARVLTVAEVEKYHCALLANKDALEHLQKGRGLNLDTIRAHHLGFDGTRIWIPVYEGGNPVNAKRHLFRGTGDKSLNYASGTGGARLYPAMPTGDTVYVTEGEFKCLLMNQMGFPAVTGTGGAKTWKPEWTPLFAGKHVVLVFDIDQAGKDAALSLARKLVGVAADVRIIDLPVSEPANADFPDYILRHGYTGEDFKRLVEQTPLFTLKGRPNEVDTELAPVEVTLAHSSDADVYFKRVKVHVAVSGKDLTPYVAPRRIEVGCDMSRGDMCIGCPLQMNKSAPGSLEYEFSPNSPDVLRMIRVNDEQQEKFIKKKLSLPACGAWRMAKPQVWRVEELNLRPEVTYSEMGNPHVTRNAYSLVPGEIKTNQSYTMVGLAIPDPETQYATILVNEAVPEKATAELFSMTPEIHKTLRKFQAKGGKVTERIDDICNDLETNVTQIVGRQDLIQAFLLTIASPRRFEFAGKMLDKGWVEGLIIGDTRTGKSETVKSLMRDIKLGELITGENLSKAGLIGGLTGEGGRWKLTWGALPMNNGGFVCVDEASGIPEEVMGDLSGIRSSGIAEVNKIVTEKTEAQVRILWVSNPRKGRFSGYAYGVHAVKELFVKPEDIARLDFACAAGDMEVSLSQINSVRPKAGERRYLGSDLNSLILWAWSRKPEQIILTQEATEECMAAASRMAQRYSSEIPLAEPAEQRIKLGRIACACAAITFSTDDGERLVVTREHVLWAEAFYRRAYDKPSMGYDLYSAQALRGASCTDEDKARIKGQLATFKQWRVIQQAFLENPHGTRIKNLIYMTGLEKHEADMLFGWLGQNGLVSSTSVGFKPTQKFSTILRELQFEPEPSPLPLVPVSNKI